MSLPAQAPLKTQALSAQSATPRKRLWRSFMYVALLAVAVFGLYEPVWHAPFLWDDDAHLTAHTCIVGPFGFAEIWTTAEANYFPLVLTHFWVLHKAFGLNPTVYHVVTIAMHVGAAVAFWQLLRKLAVPGAALAAALWALHPVQVESVAWISEFTNTQSGLFFFAGLLFGVRWLQRQSGRLSIDYWLALACATAAILSKPSAVMFPVALAFCAWWLRRAWRWRNLLWLAPFFAVALAASAWAVWEQKFHSGALGNDWNQSLIERLVICGRVVWFYLLKLVWPDPLVFVYPRWATEVTLLRALPLCLLLGVAAVLFARRKDHARPLFFAGGCFAALLFPVLGFFNVYYFRFSFVADHFQYLASAAPLALLASGVVWFLRVNRVFASSVPVVAGLILIAAALTSRSHMRAFANEESLWTSTLLANPDCVLALSNLSSNRLAANRASEAVALGEKAVSYAPEYAEPYANLGQAYAAVQGRDARAVSMFEKALALEPNLQRAHLSLANVLIKDPARQEDAIRHYQIAATLNPRDPAAQTNLALALGSTPSRLNEAIGYARAALQLDPSSAKAHLNLGTLLARLGHREEAVDAYRTALRLDPNSFGGHLNLGVALLQDPAKVDEAKREFETAISIDPKSAMARNNLAVVLARLGRNAEAIEQLREAVRLDPDYVDARNNLAQLAPNGSPEGAK